MRRTPPDVATLRRNAPNIRRIHSTFTAIFAILSAFFIALPVIWVNYELSFQSGLLMFFIIITALMLSCVMWGKELCLCRGEFAILTRHIVSILFCCLAGAFFTFFYIWNVANILSMCPQFVVNTSVTLDEQTEIGISLSYLAPDRGIMKHQSLHIRYNQAQQCLVRDQTDEPEEPEELTIETFRYDKREMQYREKHRKWLEAITERTRIQEEGGEKTEELQFYMLQQEIKMLLDEKAKFQEKSSGFTTQNTIPMHITSLEEDQQFQVDRAAKICRNEKGFGIFLLVILIIAEILYLITFIVYLWLWSWLSCLCAPKTCNACNTVPVETTTTLLSHYRLL